MNNIFCKVCIFLLLIHSSVAPAVDDRIPKYHELLGRFVSPDHANWGEVPLWWWEGDRMEKERVTWQLEILAAKE